MAAFSEHENGNRLDWWLLVSGPVSLYCHPDLLGQDIAWLQEHGYDVHSFDCNAWASETDFHRDVRMQLGFPDYYGENLNAFNDCLAEMEVPPAGGTVLQLNRFDSFLAKFRTTAWHVLDIIAHNSWRNLLMGRRLICMLQTDDPHVLIDPVGGRSPWWNRKEFLVASRLNGL